MTREAPHEGLKLFALSIATIALAVGVGSNILTQKSWLLQSAALVVLAILLFFVVRKIGDLLQADSTAR